MEKDILNQYLKLDTLPKFYDGQILSSNDLNNSFHFIEEQLNSTRSLLFGQGIISGLNFSVNKGNDNKLIDITIEAGKALTPSGVLVDIRSQMVFTHFINYNDNLYLLNEEAALQGAKPLNELENPEMYSVGIFVEEVDEEVEYCNETSCTINKTTSKRVCGAFLKETYKNVASNEELNIPKLTGLLNTNDLSVFLRNCTDYFYNNIEKIIKKLGTIESDEKELLGNITARLNELKLKFDISRLASGLSFLLDLTKACKELLKAYNIINSKSPVKPQGNEVILGSISLQEDELSGTRLLSDVEQDLDIVKNRMIFRRQINRLNLMVDNFDFEANNVVTSLFAWKNCRLGEQPLPPYYMKVKVNNSVEKNSVEKNNDEKIKAYWDAHNYRHIGTPTTNYTNYGDTGNQFLLYNYSDMPIDDFKLKMNELIVENNLPILFVRFNLLGKRESFELENYSKTELIRINKDSIDACSNKLYEQEFNSTSSAVTENDIKFSDPNLINNYRQCNINYLKEKQTLSTTLEKIRQATYLLLKEPTSSNEESRVTPSEKHFLAYLIRAISHSEYNINIKVKSGIEYIGGVNEQSVLVAVCHDDRVLLCLNLNYLDYKIYENDFELLHTPSSKTEWGDINTIFNNKDDFDFDFNNSEPNNSNPDSPGPGKPEAVNKEFNVTLLTPGRNKLATAHELRENLNIKLVEAKELVAQTPVVVYEKVSEKQVGIIKKQFKQLNAEFKIEKVIK